MARTRRYRDGVLEAEDFPAEEIPRHLAEDGVTVWLDLCEPTRDRIAAVADELGLHELAVEDALFEHERPKFHRYDTHCLLNAYAVRLDRRSGRLATAELTAFVTHNALVTVRTRKFDMDAVVRAWDQSSHLAASGVPFLLHGLVDHIVDTHFEAVQALDDHVEQLEDLVFAEHSTNEEMQRRSLAMRRSLVTLRRVVVPMREVITPLLRRDHDIVDDVMQPYFQDVLDHVLRASEWTESLRDLVATIRETQLSIQGNHLNLIMKKVTGWAAVIAVPTAVTGYYGQNVPFPGNGEPWGYWVSTGVVASLSIGLYVLFRRRDWL
ncbi:magnesium transporter CorA family protein [Saccharothrix violaceirubra]|uniref:Magnesium transporter n=1 Tax=Saccharothrix violaceirubra TaxID=413306 RepID=A0A7W7WXD0_9PSEU|nr:magnesium transporter CorA family protein [Saccharothrix violaceirubra]MBB4966991.1 magnesium transporter [Saccharothrix violaceirubra]